MIVTALLNKYRDFLVKSGVSPSTVERKLSSVRVYLNFLKIKGYLTEEKEIKKELKPNEILEKLSSLGINTKNRFLQIDQRKSADKSILGLPKDPRKSLINLIKYTLPYQIKYGQPKWLIRYRKQSYSRWVNLSLLIIFCVGLGVGIYDQFGRKTKQEGQILGTAPVSVPAYLSFQGRLTDQYNTPIVTVKSFTFSIYNVGTGGTALWTETKNITPDSDGIFNTLLGNTTTMDRTIFKDNMNLYLGVTVSGDPEMTDRQQIATVGYAFNSQYLQGYGVGATGIGAQINEIPVIDSNGLLGIAASNPTLQTTNGTFTIQSPVLVLTTTGNGNIALNPGGTGGVGIGTTNPAEILAISKSQNASTKILVSNTNTGISAYAGIKLTSDGGDALIYRTSNTYTVGQAQDDLVIHESGGGDIIFWGATEIARFSNNGNFGIGTTTPSQKLDVNGNINVGNTGLFGSLQVTSTGLVTNLNADMLDSYHASSFLQVGATGAFVSGSGTPNFVSKWTSASVQGNSLLYDDGTILGTSANVGIGTTAPTTKLHVLGSGYVTGSLNVGVGLTTPYLSVGTSASFNAISITSTGLVSNLNADYLDGLHSTSFVGTGQTAGFEQILTFTSGLTRTGNDIHLGGATALTENTAINQGAYHFGFQGTGNVGIGTTLPSYKFELLGNDNNYLASINNGNTGASAGGLYVRIDGTGNLLNLNYAGSDIFTVSQAQTTIANPANFTASGDVSIAYDLNFTNPTASYIKSLAPLVLEAGRNYESSDLTLRTYNAGNIILESANLWADGTNVGIGNTSPIATLHTIGTGIFSGNVGIGTTALSSYALNVSGSINVGASGTFNALGVTSTGLVTNLNADMLDGLHSTSFVGTGQTAGFVVGSGTPNFLSRWSSSTGLTTSLWYDNGTIVGTNANVGIGTTAPIATLHVLGSGYVTGSLNVGVGTTTPYLSVGTSASFNAISIASTGLVTNLNADMLDGLHAVSFVGVGQTAGFEQILTFTSGLTRTANTVRLGGASSLLETTALNLGAYHFGFQGTGNVGIGTTAPTQKLDINGNINVGGSAFVTGLRLDSGGALGRILQSTDSLGSANWATLTAGTGIGITNIEGTITIYNSLGIGSTVTYTAGSGLTLAASTFKLGGVLSENTRLNIGGTEVMYVSFPSGNVGIGNTAPAAGYKLDVTGNLNVSSNLNVGSSGIFNALGITSTGLVTNLNADMLDSYHASSFLQVGSTGAFVTGSGTPNFLSKWTSASVQGNSLLYDNGTILGTSANVGIGNTAPVTLFSVGSNPAAPALAVTSGGSVGIGTTGPSQLLSLYKTAVTGYQKFIAIGAGGDETFGGSIGTRTVSANTRQGLKLSSALNLTLHSAVTTAGNPAFQFQTGTVADESVDTNTVMTILGSGNVGIGTITPGTKLELSTGGADAILSIRMNNFVTGDGAGQFNQINSGRISSGNSYLSFGTSTGGTYGEKVRIDNSGNVGIGTTNPGAKLHIYHDSAAYNPVGLNYGSLILAGSNSDSDYSGIEFTNTNRGREAFLGVVQTGAGDGDLVYQNYATGSNYTEKFRITSAGNVGIGTTNPTQKLDVNGNINVGGSAYVTGLRLDSGGVLGKILQSTDSLGSANWATLTAGTGIGITNIAGTITIYNSLGIGATVTYTAGSGLTLASSTFKLGGVLSENTRLNIGNTEVMYLSSPSGNVGIGNTGPTSGYKLDVTGNLNVSGSINVGSSGIFNALGVTSTGLVTNLNADMLDGLHSTSFVGTGQTAGFEQILTFTSGLTRTGNDIHLGGATALTENTAINLGVYNFGFQGTGNVGIGTTSPTQKLDITSGNINVGGTVYVTGLRLNSGGALGRIMQSTDNLGSANWATLTAGTGIGITNIAGTITVYNSMGIGSTVTYTAGSGLTLATSTFKLGGVLSENTRLNIGNTEVMYFSHPSGNVGIGNTAPAAGYKLDVTGNLNVSASLNVGSSGIFNALGVTSTGLVTNLNADMLDGLHAVSFVGVGQTAGFEQILTFNNGLTRTANIVRLGGASPLLETTALNQGAYHFGFQGTGNVGIGTTNPSYKLDIANGNLNVGGTAYVTGLQLNSGGVLGKILQSTDNLGSANWATLAAGTGIGITNIAGTITIYNSLGVGGTVTYTAGSGLTLASSTFKLGGAISENTRLNIGNTEVMYVSYPSGNVGIGNTAPTTGYKLDVTGNLNVSGNINVGSSGIFNALGVTSTGLVTNLNADYLDGLHSTSFVGTGQTAGFEQILTFNNGLTRTSNIVRLGGASALLETTAINQGAYHFGFQGTGNVGIGTTSPTQKLDITSGNINVGGTAYVTGLRLNSGGVLGKILQSTDSLGSANWATLTAGTGIGITNIAGTITIYNSVGVGATVTYTAGSGLTLATSTFKLGGVLSENTRLNIGNTEVMYVSYPSGNVGIGNTAPTAGYKLDVTGNLNVSGNINVGSSGTFNAIGVTSTGLITNLNADFLDGYHSTSFVGTGQTAGFEQILTFNNGLTRTANIVRLGGASPLLETTAINQGAYHFGFQGAGNVGIGTTNPVQKLHVEGNCITGDSLLSVVPTDFNAGQDSSQFTVHSSQIQIKDVKTGTLVYSRNEETGKIEAQKINKLLDMGVKPVFKLKTESGKEIRTTGNHPYLVQLTNDELNSRVQLRETGSLEESYGLSQGSLSSTYEFSQTRELWTNTKKSAFADLVHLADSLIDWPDTLGGNLTQEKQFVKSQNEMGVDSPGVEPGRFGVSSQSSGPAEPTPNSLSQKTIDDARWAKVIHLQKGDLIATVSFCELSTVNCEPYVVWDKIQSIEYVGEEQVYDIEVEGTHNFIANGILAHNTYISGNVGIGTTGPSYILDVGNYGATTNVNNTIRLAGEMKNANGAFANLILSNASETGGSYFGIVARRESNNYGVSADFTVNNTGAGATPLTALTLQYNGSVGIGTTGPGDKLEISGSGSGIKFSGAGGHIIQTIDTTALTLQASDTNHYLKLDNTTNTMTLREYGNILFIPGSAGTEAMRIDSGGKVGIGATSPSTLLHLSQASQTTAAYGIQFGTDVNLYRNGTNYLRTDDSLSVGGSGTFEALGVTSTGLVTNLNADYLDGYHASSFVGIGLTGSLPYVNDATNSTLTRSGSVPYTLGLNLANSNTWTGSQYFSRAYQYADGVPTSNLGTPSVTEMALFDEQFDNKTAFFNINNIFIETSINGTTWSDYGATDDQKRKLVGGDSNSSLVIPNGTNYFRVRFRAVSYVYLNALYSYWSSSGHSTKVQIYKQHDDGAYTQHTSSNITVSSWPGHLYLPFNTIPFHPSGTLGTHYHEVSIVFIPTWNGTYPSNNISLYKMQLWGGYPAGKRNIYSVDENRNVTFPVNLGVGSSGTFNALGVTSTGLVTNLNADMLDGLHSTSFVGTGQTAGFVLGSGTPNFVSRWSTAKVLTNSLLYDNGTILGTSGNVGIGNTAPVTLFSVGWNPAAPALAVTSGGNIGIGTTNPLTSLHIVNGGTSGQTFANNYGLLLENNGSSNTSFIFQTASNGGGKSFSITNAGNVGIGTTNTLAKFSVNGSVVIGSYAGSYDGPTNGMRVSGNVAIGNTATISNKLAIFEPTDLTAFVVETPGISTQPAFSLENMPLSTDLNTGKAFQLKVTGEANGRAMFYSDGKYAVGPGSSGRDTVLSRIKANTFMISSDGTVTGAGNLSVTGNIGIGTTLPTQKLDITSGNLNVGGTAYVTGFRLNSGGALGKILQSTDSLGSANWATLTAGTGIGITNIAGTITIYNSVGIGATVTYTAGSGLTLAASTFKLGGAISENTRLNIGNTEVMYVSYPSGNVGIGTTVTSATLSIGTTADTTSAKGIVIGGDINLYRDAANQLRLDDNFRLRAHMSAGSSSAVGTNSIFSTYEILNPSGGNSAYAINATIISDTAFASGNEIGLNFNARNTAISGTSNSFIGLQGYVENLGAGTTGPGADITTARGSLIGVQNSTVETISTAIGGEFYVNNIAGGSIGTGYGVKISSPTNSGGGVFANNYGIYISDQSGPTNTYSLYVNGTPKSYFGGNVGIGTTLPTQKLDVNGNINVGSSGIFNAIGVTSIGLVTNLNADYLDGLHSSSFVGTGQTAGFVTGSGTPNFLPKFTASTVLGNSLLYDNGTILGTSANVGIGTTNPSYKLDIANGNLNVGGTAYVTGLRLNSGGALGRIMQSTDSLGSANWATLTAGTGIGITNIAGTITIYNSGVGTTYNAGNGLTLASSTFKLGGALTENTRLNIGNTEVMYLSYPSGNVGIGNTAPTAGYKLDVTGNLNVSGSINVGSSGTFNTLGVTSTGLITNLNADYLDGLHSISFVGTGQTAGFVVGSGTPNFLSRWSSSTGLTTSLWYDNGTIVGTNANVGIGTTVPTTKLHVVGAGYVTGSMNIGVGLTTPYLSVGTSASFNAISITSTGLVTNLNADFLDGYHSTSFVGTGQTAGFEQILTFTSGLTRIGNDIHLGGATALTENTAINQGVYHFGFQGTGNVGIGTTLPSYKFELLGNDNNYLASINNGNTGASAGGLYIRSDGEAEILRLNSDGSDIYTFSPTQAVFNAPTNFTSSGDVSIAYDINFTNPTASYIKSDAPLYLEAGKNYNSDDLTLRTYNAGNIILESANLWADGTNVGIGTTNPGQKLDVTGYIQSAASSTEGGFYLGSSSHGLKRYSGTNTVELYTTSGNLALMNYTSGNVGIGTTGPGADLEIKGKVGTNVTALKVTSDGNAGDKVFHFTGNEAAGYDMVMMQTGNVGIGTTNPTSGLHVRGAAAAAVVSIDTTDNSAAWNYYLDAGTLRSALGYREVNDASGNMTMFVNGADRMMIDSGGNVGIGTTGPNYKLEVSGDISLIPIGGSKILFSSDKYIYEDQNDGEAVKLRLHTAQGNEAFIIEDENAIKKFAFNIDTGKSSWLNSGNVGIGTASPVGKLHIITTDADRIILGNSVGDVNQSSPKLSLWGGAGNPATIIIGPSIQKVHKTSYGRGDLVFWQHGGADYTSETEAMVITYGGNVGIGTTSPGAGLEIDTSGTVSGFKIENGDGTDTWFNYTNGNTNYIRGTTTYVDTTLAMNNHAITDINWASSDDGSGSGLDADLVDSIHGTSFIRDDAAGDWEIASSSNSSSYGSASLEVRELNFAGVQTGVASEAPRISFHWGGRVASQIGMGTDGVIRTYDNPGTGYANFAALNISATGGLITGANSKTINIGGAVSTDITFNGTETATLRLDGGYTEFITPSLFQLNNGFYVSSGVSYLTGVVEARGGIANDTAAYLTINGGTSGYTYFAGNVGIGTASPDAKLDISGSSLHSTSTVNHYRDVVSTSTSGNPTTGTLKITLPKLDSNTMLQIKINGYNYVNNSGAWEILIGGYNYLTDWVNTSITINGSPPFTSVRLAEDASNDLILLGITTTNWYYPKVAVSEVIAGYSNITGWGTGWSMAFITDEIGITVEDTPTIKMFIDTAGNLGIGTANPDAKLSVDGTFRVRDTSVSTNNKIELWRASNEGFISVTESSTYEQLYIDASGISLRANASDTERIAIESNQVRMPGVYDDTVGATNRDLYIDNTGKLGYVSSSIRYKTNIEDINSYSSKIYDLRPVSFEYKTDLGIKQFGLIAEEVELTMPELISYNEEGQPETVSYSQFIPLLLNETIKQQTQITSLSSQMAKTSLTDTGDLFLDTSAVAYSGVLDESWMLEQAENIKVTLNSTGETISKTFGGADGIFARVKAGFIKTTNLLADNILAKRLRVEEKIISPVIDAERIDTYRLNTEIISPLAENLTFDLTKQDGSGFGKLLVEGNAEFSGNVSIGQTLSAGTVISENLAVTDATVSGELTVNELTVESARIRRLKAESIEGLEALIATITTQKISTENISGLEATPSSDLTDLGATDSAWLAELAKTWATTTPSEDIKIEDNITILGVTSLAQTIVSGSITQDGTLLLSDGNSINVLGGTLYLQDKGLGGIDLLAGKVTIDTLGNAIFEGDLTVKGTLFANTIKTIPADFEADSHGSDSGRLVIDGNIIAAGFAEIGGNIVASGSAKMAELNINRDGNLLEPGPDGVFETTASAGTAILANGTKEVIIRSPFVQEDSLVYLTPIGSTGNQVIYLKSIEAIDQTITVGVDRYTTNELQFNWWIVN